MSDRFTICLPITLAHEGGYVDHPKDPGGATNLGVTFKTLQAWRGKPITKDDVRRLTRKDVEPIYRSNYWNAANCDGYRPGADLCVFDAAVNSGVSRSRSWAGAVKVGSNAKAFVDAFCDLRLGFLKRLGTWSSFGKGWSRRVAEIRAKATTMALAGMGVSAAGQKAQLEEDAARAGSEARKDLGKATATGGTGTGGAAVVPAVGPESATSWIALAIVAVVIIGAVAFLVIRARNRKDEAQAFLREAANV